MTKAGKELAKRKYRNYVTNKMSEKITLDDTIKLLSEKRTSINEDDVDKILYQLVYQKELKLVYTKSVSDLVDKIAQMKIQDCDFG